MPVWKTYAYASIIILTIVTSAVFIASGFFLNKEYLEPWEIEYHKKFEDPRKKLIAHAVLAPNSHNAQPWKIELLDDPNSMLLYIDKTRVTPQVDIYLRQIVVSHGTFLEYMRIAATQIGYNLQVTLFPEGELDNNWTPEALDTKPVAKITIIPGDPVDHPWYDSMFIPDTHRIEYKETTLSEEQIQQILDLQTATVRIEVLQDESSLKRLDEYVYNSAEIETDIQEIYEETNEFFRFNEWQKNKYRYGLSLEGGGSTGIGLHFTQGLVTIIPSMSSMKTSQDIFLQQIQTATDHTPIYINIITKNNSRASQVEAGEVYSRLLLLGTTMGFSMHPLSQALEEYEEMSEIYSQIHSEFASNGETIQMLVRMGESVHDTPPTMRVDVNDLITQR